MARIRSVHPSLFTDEAWVSCSPLARLLVIGLWTDADDQGVFEWKPLQIKMRLLPGDAAEVPALLEELRLAGLIMKFEDGGKFYGAVRNFRKHQRPQKPNAIHPLPELVALFVGIYGTDPKPVAEESRTGTVEAQPMEDGGGRVGEEEEDLVPSEPVAATSKKRIGDEHFRAAWDACTAEMRRRSESQTKTWAHWKRAALLAGSGETLAGCLRAYLKADADVKRTGGPGFHLWLKEGRWEHWLGQAGPTIELNPWPGPDEFRLEAVSAMGEDFVRSWLDPCGWDDTGRLIVARTGLAVDRLRRDLAGLLMVHRMNLTHERPA